MFCQIVAIRWADDVSTRRNSIFCDALDALRAIPELLALTWGDDAGHFEGNFDFAAVMDFADFAAARSYAEHPLHQTYIRDHASKLISDRVIVRSTDRTPPPS